MKRSRNIVFDRSRGCARGITVGVLISAVAVAVAGSSARAQTFTGIGVPCEVTAVSGDGQTVVGGVGSFDRRAFRWTKADGIQDLGVLAGVSSLALGVSADGSVVVGSGYTPDGERAFRWTNAEGMQNLGVLPGEISSIAFGVSADGSVIVGTSYGHIGRAFRWTIAGGMQDLGALPGQTWSKAGGVSADGTIVAGTSGLHVVCWTAGGGIEDLGAPLTGFISVNGISGDGSTIVATGYAAGHNEQLQALRWTSTRGWVEVACSPDALACQAFDTTNNGSVIVGSAVFEDYQAAIRWSSVEQPLDLNVFLSSAGVNLDGWTLVIARGISDDGLVMAGNGNNPDGEWEGWVVELPSCPSDFNRDLAINSQDFFDFLNAFFSSDPSADLNADGTVDSGDFFDFLDAFFAVCP